MPAAAPGHAERDGAGDDRGGQEDRRDDTADDAPLEARPGAVVGHLLDVELAALIRLDDEDPVDLEQAGDLGVDQIVIRAHRQGRVGEARDDEGLRALRSDRALGEHALVVRHLARHGDGVVGVGCRRRHDGRLLFGHVGSSAARGRLEQRPCRTAPRAHNGPVATTVQACRPLTRPPARSHRRPRRRPVASSVSEEAIGQKRYVPRRRVTHQARTSSPQRSHQAESRRSHGRPRRLLPGHDPWASHRDRRDPTEHSIPPASSPIAPTTVAPASSASLHSRA